LDEAARNTMKTVTAPATPSDERTFGDVLEVAAEAIGEMVTSAMRQGIPLGQLAVVVERRFDGRVFTGSTLRSKAAARFGGDPKLPADARMTITETMATAGADELPIIVIVHQGEGMVAVAVRRERGEFVSVS